jgi:putative membrane protein
VATDLDWGPKSQGFAAGSSHVIDLVVRVVINAAALIVASLIVPGIHLRIGSRAEDWLKIAVIALIFAIINTFLKPIVRALSLPITLLTLGLVGLVINAAMLLVLSWAADGLNLPFKVGAFPPTLNADAIVAALIGGLIVAVVATVLSMALTARKVFGVPL